jgi:hypothetical protein
MVVVAIVGVLAFGNILTMHENTAAVQNNQSDVGRYR